MSSIEIHLKDGGVRKFPHVGRTGGSYTKTIEYVPGFVVIEDEWGRKTSIPSSLIEEVVEIPTRSF